jgi:CRP-like cAMP-binding protein
MRTQSANEIGSVDTARARAMAQAPLFRALAADQRRALAALADVRWVEPDERIVAEGARPEALFVIVSGEVEIARRVDGDTERHALRRLGAGETFGELALLEHLPTSASVYAVTPTVLLVMRLADLHRIVEQDIRFEPLFRGLAEQLNSRLRSLTDVTVRALEREVVELRGRVAMGTLLIGSVAVLSLFGYSLSLGGQSTSLGWHQPLALLVCILGLVAMAVMVRRSKLPLSFWGFTTQRWRPAVRDALLFSLPLIALMVAAKWAMIRFVDGWHSVPLLDLQVLFDAGNSHQVWDHLAQLAVYVLVAVPLQEIIIRGCMQGALQEFLTGPRRALWAIVTSNLLFAVIHTSLSPRFALLTLLPGALWGWLYYRERTLIGPILSHAIVGAAAMDVIGIRLLLG